MTDSIDRNNKIVIVRDSMRLSDIKILTDFWDKTMIKGVVDVNRNVVALGGQWHTDANTVLLGDGSKQEDVWGLKIYPREKGDAVLEYISHINIRPTQNNTSMEIESDELRSLMKKIVSELIPELNL